MNLPVTCIPCKGQDYVCEYYNFCLARMNDPTISGCGIPLWAHGQINYDAITVMHTVRSDFDIAVKADVKPDEGGSE